LDKKTKLSELIARVKSGDQEAIAQIVERFQPLLKKYGYRFGSDDAYSDLVIWMINAIKCYQPGTNWGKDELHRFLLYEKSKCKH